MFGVGVRFFFGGDVRVGMLDKDGCIFLINLMSIRVFYMYFLGGW